MIHLDRKIDSHTNDNITSRVHNLLQYIPLYKFEPLANVGVSNQLKQQNERFPVTIKMQVIVINIDTMGSFDEIIELSDLIENTSSIYITVIVYI